MIIIIIMTTIITEMCLRDRWLAEMVINDALASGFATEIVNN